MFMPVGLLTAQVVPMWWTDIPDAFLPADAYLDMTLSRKFLVIWAIVILVLSCLRSPQWWSLVGLLLLDGFWHHLFWFHPMGVFGHLDLAALHAGCHNLTNGCHTGLFVYHGLCFAV
jgi:hypothetical protein